MINDQILHLLFFRNNFLRLLAKRKQFHKVDEANENKRLLWNLTPIQIFLHVYAFICFLVVIYSIIFSFYTYNFIIPMWYPKGYPLLYNFLYYAQWIWMAFIGISEYAGICFFNTLCYEVATQFKLLGCMTAKSLEEHIVKKETVISKEMKEILCYHRFLIRYKIIIRCLYVYIY